MKISLVTNRTLREDNERLKMENERLAGNNKTLRDEKIQLFKGLFKHKEVLAQLLKEKEILAYRAASAFLGKNKVLMDEIGNLAYEIDELLMVNESTHGLWEEAVYKNFELSNKLRKNKIETKKLIDSINSRSDRDIELHKQVSKLGKHEK